jgi:Fe-S oxidoreductase
MRRVMGYNLDAFTDPGRPFDMTRILVGSEGTLGVVLEARLNLVPLPGAKAVMVIQFPLLGAALEATPAILAFEPSAVEVMDRFILDHTRANPALDAQRKAFIEGDPGAVLCLEFYGETLEAILPRMRAAEAAVRARGLGDRFLHVTDNAAQARVWGLREASLGLSMAMKGDDKSLSFVEDTAVAPERLADYIDRFLEIVGKHGTVAGVYAHASVGCLHVRPVVNLKTEEGVGQFTAIAEDISSLVLEFGGALSGEHGDGMVRSPFIRKMFGDAIYEAFREIKQTFDPDGIMNPGKIVDSPGLTANLRYGAGYRTATLPAFFDYSEYGGWGQAVEMCSGIGTCRKTLGGTMCPSYMATREEMHSTRGRANLLRLAMSGRLGEAGLGEKGIHDALDLCLECRACKTECPVGVDVGRFKSEFLASRWEKQAPPLPVRLIGNVHELARLGSLLAPLSNTLARARPLRWLSEKLIGVDARRPLPQWTWRSLEHRLHEREAEGAREPDVRVFRDTWTNYVSPEIGLAAIRLIEAGGRKAGLAPNVCCGRALISQGLLSDARKLALRNARALFPDAREGVPLIFCEPSCLSAIAEDAPDLLRGDDRDKARVVAETAALAEDYLERQIASGGLSLRFRPGPSRILVHGHCHQKAMGLESSTLNLLRRVEGAEVVPLESGCCGMAGSFGYLRAHYELSRTIGERRLLPASRELGMGERLVASGTSCRHQISDFAGVDAIHPLLLLESLAAS